MSEATDLLDQFGDAAGRGAGGGFKKSRMIKDNADNVVAVMPPMFSKRDDAVGWRVFHRLHWGFQIPQRNDPTRTQKIVFHCIEKRDRNKQVLQDCPMCTKYDKVQDTHDETKKQMEAAGKSRDEIDQVLGPVAGWLKAFAPNRKWWMNGLWLDTMEFNHFPISHKTFLQLEKAYDEVSAKIKGNPLSPRTLVFWNIKRVGSSRKVQEMSETVTPMYEVVESGGETFERIKRIAMTGEQLQKALVSCIDLADLEIMRLSYDQIKQLTECGEDPVAVEKIVSQAQVRAPAAPPAPAPAPANKPAPDTTKASGGPTQEELLRQIALLQQQLSAASKPAPAPADPPPANVAPTPAPPPAATSTTQAPATGAAPVTQSQTTAPAPAAPTPAETPKPAAPPVTGAPFDVAAILKGLNLPPSALGLPTPGTPAK